MNYRLLTFDPAFQNAIRESLLTGSAVEVRPGGMPLPENEGQLPRFCEGVLAGCPLKIEVLLLDGRSVQISLQWLVADTTVVRVLAKDITAQKPAQAERLKTARQSLDGFDRAMEGIYRTTADGRLLAANRSFARMLGFEDVDHALSAITDVSRDLWEDPDQRTAFLEELEKHGSIEGYECRLKGRDGVRIWASVNSRRVCGEHGELLYLEGFIQDITAKKEAEKLLRDSEERYRASFEQAAVGILHTSFEGRILRCNRRFAEIARVRSGGIGWTDISGDHASRRSSAEQFRAAKPHGRSGTELQLRKAIYAEGRQPDLGESHHHHPARQRGPSRSFHHYGPGHQRSKGSRTAARDHAGIAA